MSECVCVCVCVCVCDVSMLECGPVSVCKREKGGLLARAEQGRASSPLPPSVWPDCESPSSDP